MIFILNKQEKVINTLKNNTTNSASQPFYDDVLTEDLHTGAETFVFYTLAKNDLTRDLSVGNYVAFIREGKYKLFQISYVETTHEETMEIMVYCEGAGLTLTNSIFRQRSMVSTTISRFLTEVLESTDWKLGYVDEKLQNTLDLNIEADTCYNVIQQYIGLFEAEIEFRVELNSGQISKKYIDVHSQRGKYTGKRFTYGKDIESITRTVDSTKLCTALIGIGKNGETFRDIQVEGIDKPLGQDFVADQQSFDTYNRNGYHLMGLHSVDSSVPQDILIETYKELQNYKEPRVTYEIPVVLLSSLLDRHWEKVSIGDYITIRDNKFNPALNLLARVIKLESSTTDKNLDTCTLSNFVEIKTTIDEAIKKLSSEMIESNKELGNRVDTIENKVQDIVYCYDTLFDLKNSNNIKDGDSVRTLGYYKVDDGGGANYKIETTSYDWSIPIGKNNYYANIYEKESVNYRQFGALLDGKNDDEPYMILCHKYADSIKTLDNDNRTYNYHCTVRNKDGIIYKQSTEPIRCKSDVDLSGSTLLVDDTNATWFGIYVWGDIDSLYWDYELQEMTQRCLTADSYVVDLPANDELPANCVLRLEESPYSVRDDDGYLYSVARRELFVHDIDGIFSTPSADDWTHAGGEEINCVLSNLENNTIVNKKEFSALDASYTFIPTKRGYFKGCEIIMNMSADKYSSVLTAKRHNATISDFYFKPKTDKMHNTKYKNSMIYVQDSCNVKIKNIQGFNAAGKKQDGKVATSGYVLRLTNCLDVTVENVRLQGYWGANAMDSVKNVHFIRCSMNRLDVHDYFYNLTATECNFYHHAVQIGYGRGLAAFNNCNFYYNDVKYDSYPEGYGVTLNLTYGRTFEGLLTLNDCNVHVKNAPNNEYNLIQMRFRPEATSIVKHFKFPEIRCKNIHVNSDDENLNFSYVKIAGSRNARTGLQIPTHVYNQTDDGTTRWEYVNRCYDWRKQTGQSFLINENDFIRFGDTVLNEEGKTLFYNVRHYRCTSGGNVDFFGDAPEDSPTLTLGEATFVKENDILWKSRHNYQVGDYTLVSNSKFYQPYVFRCIKSGVSDGYFPIHTEGTQLEGSNDPVSEPDLCWWEYIGKKDVWLKDFTTNTVYGVGQRFMADGRIYEVTKTVESTDLPPFETPWLDTTDYGGGVLLYLGNKWEPKKWYKMGSYCEADGRIYKLVKHDGITTGVLPVKGNLYCVDGDLTWEYVGQNTLNNRSEFKAWKPNTHYEQSEMIKVGNNMYEVQNLLTGSSSISNAEVGKVYMDGTIPVEYYGEHNLGWRVAGNTYNVGDVISDNTWLVICTKSGTTNASDKWGPLESASKWGEDGKYIDGDCEWEKLTKTSSDGYWRNSNRYYAVDSCLIINASPNMRVFKVIETKTGTVEPTMTTPNVSFLDGTTTLQYKGINDGWYSEARYNQGDLVNAGFNVYRCAFDGRLVLPNKTIFENITTNVSQVTVFKFDTRVDVPTKKGAVDWNVILRYCDNIKYESYGLPSGIKFFGGANTINPIIKRID